jgi:RNA polymerase sigma-70 factor (ECF subfamily)
VISDEELVRRTLSESSHHFGELIQRYANYLFGLGMRLTSGNKELSEDISQQTFMKAYAGLKSFDSGKIFKHWLTGIAVNSFKDLIIKENQYISIDEHNEPSYTPDLDGDRDFFSLISPLTNEERLIFTLRFVYDYQVDEIGDFLDIKSGTIKSKLSRAIEKLR